MHDTYGDRLARSREIPARRQTTRGLLQSPVDARGPRPDIFGRRRRWIITKRFSTDDVEQKARLDYWRHVCGELIGSVELADCQSEGFASSVELSTVADLKFGRFLGASQSLHRRDSMIRSGDSDNYCILLGSEKTFNNAQAGHQRSGANGILLIDIAQASYGHHPEGLDVLDVLVPRAVLQRALGPVRTAVGLTIEPDQSSYPVLSNFLRSLHAHGATLDGARAERMASVAVDLIAAGFAEKIAQVPDIPPSAAALLCRAQAFIADRIDSPGLNMRDVAAGLGISVRQLHQVAAEENLSLVDWMWERRLARARMMLAEPANNHLAIGWIAFRCGFTDQAHFARRFKERFGLSAKAFRDEAASKSPS